MTPEPASENRNGWIYLSVIILLSIIGILFILTSSPASSIGPGSSTPVMIYKTTVTKVSPEGRQEWQTKIPGIGDPVKVLSTSDGGYAIYGSFGDPKETQPALQVVKLDGHGKKEWIFQKGMYGYGFPVSLSYPRIMFESEGGYTIFTGSGVVVHLDSQGNDQWFREYAHNDVYNIIQTNEGQFILTGDNKYREKPTDVSYQELIGLVMALDSNGTLIWERKDHDYTHCNQMLQYQNGTILVVCSKGSWDIKPSPNDVLAMDIQGNVLWKKNLIDIPVTFPPMADSDAGVHFIKQTLNNNQNQLTLFSANGIEDMSIIFNSPSGEEVYKVLPTSDGDYLILSGVRKNT